MGEHQVPPKPLLGLFHFEPELKYTKLENQLLFYCLSQYNSKYPVGALLVRSFSKPVQPTRLALVPLPLLNLVFV